MIKLYFLILAWTIIIINNWLNVPFAASVHWRYLHQDKEMTWRELKNEKGICTAKQQYAVTLRRTQVYTACGWEEQKSLLASSTRRTGETANFKASCTTERKWGNLNRKTSKTQDWHFTNDLRWNRLKCFSRNGKEKYRHLRRKRCSRKKAMLFTSRSSSNALFYQSLLVFISIYIITVVSRTTSIWGGLWRMSSLLAGFKNHNFEISYFRSFWILLSNIFNSHSASNLPYTRRLFTSSVYWVCCLVIAKGLVLVLVLLA